MDGTGLSDGFQRLGIHGDNKITSGDRSNGTVNSGNGEGFVIGCGHESAPLGHGREPQNRVPEEFQDITERFFQESQTLLIGQLIQDPKFTLLEAVGALEIMDPKMDSGLMPAITEEQFNVYASRTPEEIIGVMDQLLAHEMAWHNGSALSQTVFICLYVDKLLEGNPSTIEDTVFSKNPPKDLPEQDELLLKVIRAYCLGVVQCCSLVNLTVMPHVLEEEDFVTQTYNVSLMDSISPDIVCKELEATIKRLNDEGPRFWPTELLRAIGARLSHKLVMLRGVSLIPERYYEDRAYAVKNWEECAQLCKVVEETHKLGKPVPEAFSTFVQRKLATTVPPRPEVMLEFVTAIGSLAQMCGDIKDMVKICDYISPGNVLNFLLHFNMRKPQPSTYVRSVLQSILVHNLTVLGKTSFREFIVADLVELCCPLPELVDPTNDAAEAPQSARFQINKQMKWFVDRAMNMVLQLFQRLCMNRPRVRRMMCHALIEWDNFQSEAELVDAELREFTLEVPVIDEETGEETYSYPLSSWAFHYKLRIMHWIVLLGFELEIYQPYEYAGMYWQAQNYLRMRVGHLERIRVHIIPRDGHVQAKDLWRERMTSSMHYLTYLCLEVTAACDLSAALMNVHRLLLLLGLVRLPKQPYSSGEMRYLLRMKPFMHIGVPEMVEWEGGEVPWEYFQEEDGDPDRPLEDALQDLRETLEEARQYVADARKHFDLLNKMRLDICRAKLCEGMFKNSLRDVLRSCIGTSITVSSLDTIVSDVLSAAKANKDIAGGVNVKRIVEKAGWKVRIEGGKGGKYHSWFPVVVLTRGDGERR